MKKSTINYQLSTIHYQLSTINYPQLEEIWQQTLQWQPNYQQQQLFQQLYEEILTGNGQLNLTRITEPKEFWEKHLWDSLAAMKGLEKIVGIEKIKCSQKVIDIGTGAGFPGIPVAIAFPPSQVTLLDATRKKIAFLTSLINKLAIENAMTLSGRAEDMGRSPSYRATYDIALVRAVGSPSVVAEYALPLLKIGGVAILYRGVWSHGDTEMLEKAVLLLGSTIESIESFVTPLTKSVRHCIYLRKTNSTPSTYPRAVGIPTKEPL